MVKRIKKILGVVLMNFFALLIIGSFVKTKASSLNLNIIDSGGWYETAYIKWSPLEDVLGYNVYIKPSDAIDSQYKKIDNELIRQYGSYWRADAVGLSAGQYVMKVEALFEDEQIVSSISGVINVEAYDRSGFAFSGDSLYGTGSGAYNDDGTLRSGAKVIYLTPTTAKTVKLDVIVNDKGGVQTGIGIGQILELRKKGRDKTPLAIRIIGKLTDNDLSGQLNSSGYLEVKADSGAYSEMNITLEGIGEDAYAYGWGILTRNVGNLEIRNLGIALFPDDGISLDTGNCNIWIHNNDIFYGKAGSDSDQAKGDGSTDLKYGSTYITISYNHYWESGKVSLCGMTGDNEEFFVTYHHNWFDHSDSRHPRIRVASVHAYNNYFDGISKYGVGVTMGSSAFVETNYFRNAKKPMLSSKQGTDALGEGTFSGEVGGMIKAYNNIIVGANSLIYANSDDGTAPAHPTSFDAYLASSRGELVPITYKALVGGTPYNNFDTKKDLGVSVERIDDVEDVEEVVTTWAGRLNQGDFTWEFNNEVDDNSYDMNQPLMDKIRNYSSAIISIGGNSSVDPEEPTDPEDPTDPVDPITGIIVHNFTTNGKNNDFFSITGNLSTSKGTVNYKGLVLTQCLKIESSTLISFTTTSESELTLVFLETGKKIKVDGISYTTTDGGILNLILDPGEHTITKGDVMNLFYMELVIEDDGEGPIDPEDPVDPVEPTDPEVPELIFKDDFSDATSSTFFDASYKSLPHDSNTPMYIKVSGTVNVVDKKIILSGGRMTIGALAVTLSTPDTTPGGIFDFTKPYRIIIKVSNISGDNSKKFIVYIDNNTTGQANSIHGGDSKVFEKTLEEMTSGEIIIEPTIGTKTSFIQFRTETDAVVEISEIIIEYIIDDNPVDPEDPIDPKDPNDPEDPVDPEDPNDPEDPEFPNDRDAEQPENKTGKIILYIISGITIAIGGTLALIKIIKRP